MWDHCFDGESKTVPVILWRTPTERVVRCLSHAAPRPRHVRVRGFGGDAAGEEGLRIVVGLEALSSGRVGRFFSRNLRGGDSVS